MNAPRSICLVVLVITVGNLTANANEVGYMPAEFSVSKHGEATYQIPIVVPPGAGGLQPELALSYHSNAGNGPLGLGWSVAGLSAITRCPATVAQDGWSGSVTYQASDRFCLDGQRLMKISGIYAADGSRYRTEIESFQDIYGYDDDADGHINRFLVRDKAGLTRQYGFRDSSRIEAQGRPYAKLWMLDKTIDKFGNHIEFDYAELTGAGERGEFWVTHIDYRNATGQNIGRIEFHYDTNRADKTYGYGHGGSMFSGVVRLNRIDVYGHDGNNGWSAARRYELSYQTSSTNSHSLLQEVRQCDAVSLLCLPPTRMNYFVGENGINTTDFAVLPAHYSNQFMDVNGDGRVDQVYEWNYRWTIRLSGSHDMPYVTGIDSNPHARDNKYTRVLDHNGDGMQDLLVANTVTGRWEILESTGTGLVVRDTGRSHFGAYLSQPVVSDLDGDGLPEILFKHNGWLKFYKNNGGAYSAPVDTDFKVTSPQVLTPLQYDGDGRPDLVVNMDGCASNGGPGGPADPIPPWHPKGQSRTVRATTHCSQTAGILTWSELENNLVQLPMAGLTDTSGIGGEDNDNRLLDFNGDGLTDLAIAPTADAGQWSFFLNKGGSWVSVWSGHNGENRDEATVFDYDDDGRQELWLRGNGYWYRLRPDISATAISFTAIPSGSFSNENVFFIDWTGDGLGDLVFAEDEQFFIRAHKGSKSGLLQSIENGLGDETRVAYVAMSDIGAELVYGGNTGTPVFPDRHYRMPIYLVRSVAADSGLYSATGSDFKVTTNYTYHGAKLNQHGRGFLGFSKIEAHNVNTEIVTYNTHSQDFPYTGMVTRAEQWTPDVPVRVIDWDDISDEFQPCLPASGPCIQPRSAADENGGHGGPGTVTQQRNTIVPGEKLSETVNILATRVFDAGTEGQRYWPYRSVGTEYQLNYRTIDVIRRTVTTAAYDDYGNATSFVVTVDDGSGSDVHQTSTANTYLNWTDDRWCLGRLMDTTVIHARTDYGSGGPLNEVRQSSFDYDHSTCQLNQEVIEPHSSDWKLQKDYDHDAYGNRTAETVSGPDIASRTTTTQYDEFGQFPVLQANSLGHQVQFSWDYTLGHKLTTTDVNLYSSTLEYDALGRLVRETAPGATLWKETGFEWCAESVCDAANAVYKTIQKTSTITAADRIHSIAEYDQLGREVLSRTRAFDGTYIYKKSHYDSAGRLYASSSPHYANEVSCWTVNHYDSIGRISATYKPSETQDCLNYGNAIPDPSSHADINAAYGSVTVYAYDGLETRITNAQGRTVTRVVNTMDRLVTLSEHDDNGQLLQTNYDYDAVGQLAWVRDTHGNVAHTVHNVRGFKVSLDDPDVGHWEYQYNTLGQLIRQQDAKNQITEWSYDLAGRMTQRVGFEGTTSWFFDDPALDENQPDYHGASSGKITRVTGPGGYKQYFRYAGLHGELTQRSELLDGIWYYYDFHYDDQGRIDRTVAPAVGNLNTESEARRLQLVTTFNAYGYPYLLREYRNDAYGNPLWRAISMDAMGKVTEERTHNDAVTAIRGYDRATGALLSTSTGTNGAIQNESYRWDSIGNLVARNDYNQGWSESFSYDGFSRLNDVTLGIVNGGIGDITASNRYDAIGNILCRNATAVDNENCSGGYRDYGYGAMNTSAADDAGPHAVTRVTTSTGERNYHYDNNGNLTRVTGGGPERYSEWYSYNKLKKVWRKSNSAQFWYRPGDYTRWKQVNIKGSETTTIYYIGNDYERRLRSGQATEHVYYVQAADRVIGKIIRYGDDATVSEEQYFHRDHLGSIVALTNGDGAVIERLSYDAWGKRRSPISWITPGANSVLYALDTQRGFTGHEHVDNLGLINMNGRLYDFETGRFLSADPFVQQPASLHGFNRYSYAQNNPLSYSDPTGFFIKGLVAKIAGAIVTTITGQPLLGHLVQGYLSSGGDIKALAVTFVFRNPYAQNALEYYQYVRAGIDARKSGDRFANGVLGAMKNRIIGRLKSIGQDYLIDTGQKITASIRTASASNTGAAGSGDKGTGTANSATSDSFENAATIEFEAALGVRIMKWLETGINQDGEFFASVRGQTVSITLDENGNLTFSGGSLSTSMQIMRDDFAQLARQSRDSFGLDLSVVGAKISVLPSGNIQWRAHLKTAGLLGKLGIRGRAGFKGTFDPSAVIRSTYAGQAGYEYRGGTTPHVDRCWKSDFKMEGC